MKTNRKSLITRLVFIAFGICGGLMEHFKVQGPIPAILLGTWLGCMVSLDIVEREWW